MGGILPRAAAKAVADVPIVLGKFVVSKLTKKVDTTQPHMHKKTN
jgi:hypothetical protein